ncbi:sensor histidine kinase [Paenibacillus koleovorans]|uniref:sensor histidine kinase n=1 Tax=Paenibacillus koleovorans TaxID=121608 RepID=UPI0013E3A82A|nr:ATP-binding protein [Paenibacillus koleovorans]
MTSLREEVAYAKTYIRIMSFRYKDRIHCEWRIDEELSDAAVVKMILQPIQENAIRHALRAGVPQVRISIDIAREGETLKIAVADNGPSLSEEKLAEIRANLERRDRGKVGLYNVNSRIKLHFGEEYGLALTNGEAGGVTVVLTIPVNCMTPMETDTKM